MKKLLAILLRIVGIILYIPLLFIGMALFLISIICEIIYYGELTNKVWFIPPDIPNCLFKLAKKLEK